MSELFLQVGIFFFFSRTNNFACTKLEETSIFPPETSFSYFQTVAFIFYNRILSTSVLLPFASNEKKKRLILAKTLDLYGQCSIHVYCPCGDFCLQNI